MKLFSLLLITFMVCFSTQVVFAEDPLIHFEGAKYVESVGPAISGVSPYGKMKVINKDGECYEYLTDNGHIPKYKKCDSEEWIDISNWNYEK